VLDPFAGSGMALAVAGERGHPAVGIELSGGYCEHIARRLRGPVALTPADVATPSPRRAAGQRSLPFEDLDSSR
jgi:hypothetical protein